MSQRRTIQSAHLLTHTPHFQCTTPTTTTLLLLPTQPPSNFMSRLPDTQSLSSMCIPGTHETFARYGWPISQCQEDSSTIAKQLNDGIRFMDFRVRPDGEPGQERLWAFHGSRPQRIELGQALDQVYEWLDGVGCKGELASEKVHRPHNKSHLVTLSLPPIRNTDHLTETRTRRRNSNATSPIRSLHHSL